MVLEYVCGSCDVRYARVGAAHEICLLDRDLGGFELWEGVEILTLLGPETCGTRVERSKIRWGEH